ncbi:hypothetical protein I4U23_027369 [Adineta vaga]|nr:hypothetical protein I4U23_027369 [Adineta vaga]
MARSVVIVCVAAPTPAQKNFNIKMKRKVCDDKEVEYDVNTKNDNINKKKICTNEIDGLQLIQNFIDKEQQKLLWSKIYKENWSKEITRDTLHYGQRYDYKTRTLVNDVQEIPEWLNDIKKEVEIQANFESPIDQIIINKYKKGQSISPHIDHKVLFGPTIATLSLGTEVNILFQQKSTKKSINASECSLLVMKRDSRYQWKHSLKLSNVGERISITFRTINKSVKT